jgi:hypothetical protein
MGIDDDRDYDRSDGNTVDGMWPGPWPGSHSPSRRHDSCSLL